MRRLVPVLLLVIATTFAAEGLFERGLYATTTLTATPAALLGQDPEALWLLGAAELAQRQPRLATENLEALILEQPNQRHLERSLFMLGRGYSEMGLHHRAAASYRTASRLSAGAQTRNYAIYRLGESLYDAGDYAGALEAYRRMEREDRNGEVSWGVYFAMAQAQLQLGRLEGAIDDLRRAREGCAAPPLRAQIDYWLGWALASSGRYETAARAYADSLTEPHPLTERAGFERGLTLFILEDYAGAAYLLGRSSEPSLDEDSPYGLTAGERITAAYYAGWAGYSLGEYSEAGRRARGLLDDPTYGWGARWLLAESALAGGDYALGAEQFGLLALASGGEEAYRAGLKQGLCLYHHRDYPAAEAAFAGIASTEGDDVASYWMAMAVKRQGDLRRAEALFRPVHEAGGPLAPSALLELAHLATNTGRHREAVARYSELLETYPDGPLAPLALYSRGQARVRAGEHQLGQNDYAALLERFPGDELADDALYLLAMAAYETRRYAEALPLFQRLTTDYPQSRYVDYARLRRADCLYALGDYAAARRAYSLLASVTRLSSVADDAAYGEELCAWRLGEYPDVVAATSAYLRRRPNSYLAPELTLTLARHYRDTGDTSRAVELYRKIISDYPRSEQLAAASAELALSLVNSGRDSEVIELLERALAQTPPGPGRSGLHFQLARAARRQGDYSLALEHYNMVIHNHPAAVDWIQANFEVAAIYRELGQPASARRALERIIAARPVSPTLDRAYLELAFVEQGAGYESRALEYHRLAAESSDPGIAVQALFWLGEIHYNIAEFDEALDIFQRLVDRYGDAYPSYCARSILRRANIYERRRQPQAARRQYLKILEGDFARSFKDRAAERLALLE